MAIKDERLERRYRIQYDSNLHGWIISEQHPFDPQAYNMILDGVFSTKGHAQSTLREYLSERKKVRPTFYYDEKGEPIE